MNPFVQALVENHKAFGMPILHTPTIPMSRAKMRIGLIEEETDELFQACFREESIVDAADALIDLLYVVVGAMLEFGLTDIVDELFNEVQRSNMSKLGEDGKPIYREDGKYLKGPNYSPPNLAAIIDKSNGQLELFNGDE